MIPTYGDSTIRSFSGNLSDLKRLAGHDLEDILQVLLVANVADGCANSKISVYNPLH